MDCQCCTQSKCNVNCLILGFFFPLYFVWKVSNRGSRQFNWWIPCLNCSRFRTTPSLTSGNIIDRMNLCLSLNASDHLQKLMRNKSSMNPVMNESHGNVNTKQSVVNRSKQVKFNANSEFMWAAINQLMVLDQWLKFIAWKLKNWN